MISKNISPTRNPFPRTNSIVSEERQIEQQYEVLNKSSRGGAQGSMINGGVMSLQLGGGAGQDGAGSQDMLEIER